MDWTTVVVAAGTFVGGAGLTLLTQRTERRAAREDARAAAEAQRLAARESEDAAEARELRREARLRGREAAETALEAVRYATDDRFRRIEHDGEGEGDTNDDASNEVLSVLSTHLVYLPDDVRQRLQTCSLALSFRHTAARMGAGRPGQLGWDALQEMRETLGAWLRNGGPPTGADPWWESVNNSVAAIKEDWEATRQAEEESREEARRARDK